MLRLLPLPGRERMEVTVGIFTYESQQIDETGAADAGANGEGPG